MGWNSFEVATLFLHIFEKNHSNKAQIIITGTYILFITQLEICCHVNLVFSCTSKEVLVKDVQPQMKKNRYSLGIIFSWLRPCAVSSIFSKKKLNKLNFFFAHENMKKLPSKVAHNWPKFFFQYCQPAQNQPKSHILFHKNGYLRDFYIMTLVVTITHKLSLDKILSKFMLIHELCNECYTLFQKRIVEQTHILELKTISLSLLSLMNIS